MLGKNGGDAAQIQNCLGSGVDVAAWDAITSENLPQSAALIRGLAKRTGAVIAVSGVMDVA